MIKNKSPSNLYDVNNKTSKPVSDKIEFEAIPANIIFKNCFYFLGIAPHLNLQKKPN
ncbi:hypothetical protein AMCSP09_000916 [Streptococcus pneumoniae 2081074]|nr:hypothetical protein AMCSP09_000916 [Streptococcus pneumoniae 2081074]EJG81882.1 hypothetical protein SPAR48_0666 [Streptococcus pneumoniae SPAR48]